MSLIIRENIEIFTQHLSVHGKVSPSIFVSGENVSIKDFTVFAYQICSDAFQKSAKVEIEWHRRFYNFSEDQRQVTRLLYLFISFPDAHLSFADISVIWKGITLNRVEFLSLLSYVLTNIPYIWKDDGRFELIKLLSPNTWIPPETECVSVDLVEDAQEIFKSIPVRAA